MQITCHSTNMALSLRSTLRILILLVGLCLVSSVTESQIRLYGGPSNDTGSVQVNVARDWNNICNDDWDVLDALVVCRELGFTEGYALLSSGNLVTPYNYGGSESAVSETPHFPFDGRNFACNGTEKSLLSCKYNYKEFDSYCETAQVACGITEARYKEIRDAEFTHDYEEYNLHYTFDYTIDNSNGRVLLKQLHDVRPSGAFLSGGICKMNEQAARLICRQQGYTNGGKAIQIPAISNLPMVFSQLSCYDRDFYYCSKSVTDHGICPDGVQFNGVKCYTTLIPSVIGALAFAAVACIFLIIAGAVAIRWIKRNGKTPNSSRITLNVGDQCDATTSQTA